MRARVVLSVLSVFLVSLLLLGLAAPTGAHHNSNSVTYVKGTSSQLGAGVYWCIDQTTQGLVQAGVGGCLVSCPPGDRCVIEVTDDYRGEYGEATGFFSWRCGFSGPTDWHGEGLLDIPNTCRDGHVAVFTAVDAVMGTITATSYDL